MPPLFLLYEYFTVRMSILHRHSPSPFIKCPLHHSYKYPAVTLPFSFHEMPPLFLLYEYFTIRMSILHRHIPSPFIKCPLYWELRPRSFEAETARFGRALCPIQITQELYQMTRSLAHV